MNVDLTAGTVRILTSEGMTVGTGFVVTDDALIATCAHVVEAAGAGLGSTVRVIFHATGAERGARVEPKRWRAPDAEDVAILRLEEPLPEAVEVLLLGSSDGTSGHPFKTFGFPAVKDVDGMWGYGNLGDPITEAGRSLLQLTGTTEITAGFSGAPVLDAVTRCVVGMVTAITIPDEYGRLPQTAFITPTETLRAVCPKLQISDLCPYQGLAAFTEANAEFFFGREKLVADLVDHLRGNPRFLAVVGPSGSGKSSVVLAGLFPALRRGEVPGSEDWHLLTFRPGADPSAALTAAGLDVPQEGDLQTAARAFLETHPQVKRLVLFADQFEEVFVLCPEPMQARFLSQLLALLESDLRITVILALRGDFYGHLLRRQSLVDWLKVGQVNVPPMEPEELRAAVEEPATKLGLRFDPGLVETIVEEAGEEDHPLALLESALTRLWEKREEGILTHAAYEAAGRVAGALSQWAEDAYSGLDPEEQSLARRVFTRLVHYGEGGATDTRQRQSLPELVTRPEEQETLHRLVRRLADARLLVTGGEPGAETAEIIHDALLREWGWLRRWVTGQREFYLWRQRLDERLQEWESKGQDEGALLRGALLAEAERYAVERSDDLNLDEREYIQDSIALRERERVAQERLRRRITMRLAVGLLAALVLVAFARAQWRRAEEQRQIAAARQLAAQSQMALDITSAGLIRGSLLAIESLRHYPTLEGDQALIQRLALLPRPLTQMRHKGSVEAVAFSPDGRWLATGGTEGTAYVWQAATGREVARVTHKGSVRALTFSPDGRWLATGDDYGTVRVWEAATGREVARVTHEQSVQAIAFSPDGRWLATGDEYGTARVWEAATGREVARVTHEQSVQAIAFSPDGHWLATGGWDGTARVWEAATGQEIARMVHAGPVVAVAFSPDGHWLATGSGDVFSGGAQVWEAATGQEVARMAHRERVGMVAFDSTGRWLATGSDDYTARVSEAVTGQEVARVIHKEAVKIVSFSPDGRWMVSVSGEKNYTGDYEPTVRVWDIVRGREVARLPYEEPVLAISFSPNGRWLATGGRDGAVQVWEMVMGCEVSQMTHSGPVEAVAFSPDGGWLATGSLDATARIWEVATGDELIRMEPEQVVLDVAFSPDGRWLATASRVPWTDSGEARVWDVVTGDEIARMAHGYPVLSVAFSPNGRWLATGAFASPVTVWEAATGGQIAEVACCSPTDVAFSPDGHWLAIGGLDGGAGVWDVVTEEEIARMGHGYTAWAVTFSPDGRWLATGSADSTARVWKAATGREVTRMVHGQNSAVESVAFSPDGRWLATGSADGTARVWEVATGQEVNRMVYEDMVSAVTFSPDGRWLATGSADGTARVSLWRLEDLVAEVCARLPRNLTQVEWKMYLPDEPYRPTCPNLSMPEE